MEVTGLDAICVFENNIAKQCTEFSIKFELPSIEKATATLLGSLDDENIDNGVTFYHSFENEYGLHHCANVRARISPRRYVEFWDPVKRSFASRSPAPEVLHHNTDRTKCSWNEIISFYYSRICIIDIKSKKNKYILVSINLPKSSAEFGTKIAQGPEFGTVLPKGIYLCSNSSKQLRWYMFPNLYLAKHGQYNRFKQ